MGREACPYVDRSTYLRKADEPFRFAISVFADIARVNSGLQQLERGYAVICAGGGGIPVVAQAEGRHRRVEAVVDKDRSAALLAAQLKADLFVIATDVQGVYLNCGKPSSRLVARANPGALGELAFSAGSMAPKVEAACGFASRTGRRAVTVR